jgi:hypothetical protein
MLTVGDFRRQLACELKRTERQLLILFSNAVLREDSKTLKEYGLGKRFGALCIVIEPDDMNNPSPLRFFKDFPTLEAADSKKDDSASDLLTSWEIHGRKVEPRSNFVNSTRRIRLS